MTQWLIEHWAEICVYSLYVTIPLCIVLIIYVVIKTRKARKANKELFKQLKDIAGYDTDKSRRTGEGL